jgi:uncharacterized protein
MAEAKMMRDTPPLPPILPVGTAVVALVEVRGADGRVVHPRGAAGVIVKAPGDPEHSYRVRFAGAAGGTAGGSGDEVSMKRREIQPLKHFQRWGGEGDSVGAGLGRTVDPLTEYDLYQHVIYRCIVGSRAYGLERDASDFDRRGVYLPPASMQWSIYGVPEQLESPETEEVYWELEKFLKLALKANPNVLEALWTPLVEYASPLAGEMLEMRSAFLSKLVYQTYNGYAMSQFKKLGQDLRVKGAIKWKHAMHLLRLLLAGIEVLRTGEVPVRVSEEFRERLVLVRDGEMAWEEVDRWRVSLHREFERAFVKTGLPERPDYERVNTFLVKARLAMVPGGY